MGLTKYEKHIRELCRINNIDIEIDERDNSANMLDKIVWIRRRQKTIRTYFGALHEIAHVLNEYPEIYSNINRVLWNQTRCDNSVFWSKFRMKAEVDAWKRAFELSKWSNFTADKLTVQCLFTYIWEYNQSHIQPFKGINNEFITSVLKKHKDNKQVIGAIKQTLFA